MTPASSSFPRAPRWGRELAAQWFASAGASYWLTRFVLLRLLGLVYFVAFLVAARQNAALIGRNGLLPAEPYLNAVADHFGSRFDGFLQMPSVFWFGISDNGLSVVAWSGVVLSAIVLCGYANAVLLAVLWALYMSFVHVGQLWYSYGWEIQLLETGFLAIFLCPLLDGRPFPRRAPPAVVFWLYRWMIFRIMIGAGLIKLRGDPCWRDLTCLYFHYETQPIPNPLSWWLHFRPHWFHQFGTLWNHVVELVVPWFAFWGRRGAGEGWWVALRNPRHVAGLSLASFQVVLILSGNLSFLNWLTIVPCLACFDDSFWCRVLPRFLIDRAERAAAAPQPSRAMNVAALAIAVVVAFLSIDPVVNLFSQRQIMNTSFNRLHLVNTYGAFGSVGRVRNEIVFEGTSDAAITGQTQWMEYEFKAKPGDVRRRPALIAPYQSRIDWQIWFAAMATPNDYPWTAHFVWKLLHNDAATLGLIANNPFPAAPPRHVRAMLYRYEFAPPGDPSGAWWKRTPVGLWLPPFSTDNPELLRFLSAHGWLRTDELVPLKRP
ncbi:MAG TPA: lipase maturation factor family protein [Verrucomicrobiae bacterium]